jgi:Uma2 family endonuclease
MAPATTLWTVDQLQAMPEDGHRRELVGGVLLVTPAPSPTHQSVVLRLAIRIAAYLDTVRVGALFLGPGDVVFDANTLVQPDLFVTPLNAASPPTRWVDAGRPILAVEVISPGSAGSDRGAKRRLYQREGVSEYWIVDPDAQLVERWRPDDSRPEVLSGRIVWQPSPSATPLEISLDDLWKEVASGR